MESVELPTLLARFRGLARARRKEQVAPPDPGYFVALIAHAQTMTCRHPRPVSNTLTKEKGIHSCLVTEWVRAVRDTLMTGTVKSRKPTQQSDYGDERAACLARISRGTKAVPEIQATVYVARMRGPSRRDLLRCDDGEYYIAKVRGSPQHVRILANETVASRLALLIGLPVPPWLLSMFRRTWENGIRLSELKWTTAPNRNL